MSNSKRSKTRRLVARADTAANYAAREAVTKLMTEYLTDSDLPVKGLSWTVSVRPDGTSTLSGHVESGISDVEVRSIVDDYVAAWNVTGKANVEIRPALDEGLSYIEATGLEVDDSPAEVWGVLGYSAGESSE